MKRPSAIAIGALLGLTVGCVRTTELGDGAGPESAGAAAGAAASPMAEDPPQASAQCRSVFADGGGAPLLDPPGTCTEIYSSCDDGVIYQVQCDGRSCRCIRDGWPDGSILTPRCVSLSEASQACGWDVANSDPPGTSTHQGAPCTADAMLQDGCVCTSGVVDCPGDNGCFISGRWRTEDGTRTLVLNRDGTVFSSEDPGADLESIEQGLVRGFYGTWQFSDGTLFMSTTHLDGDPACQRLGVFPLALRNDCRAILMAPSADACMERTSLDEQELLRE